MCLTVPLERREAEVEGLTAVERSQGEVQCTAQPRRNGGGRKIGEERHAAHASTQARAAEADGAGEIDPGRIPGGGAGQITIAPLHAEVAREIRRRLNDVRLDEYLRRLHIEAADQLARVVDAALNVAHHQRVGVLVDE